MAPDVCDFFPEVEHRFSEVRGFSMEVAGFVPEVRDLSSEPAGFFPEAREVSSEVADPFPDRGCFAPEDVDVFPEVRDLFEGFERLREERKDLLSEIDRPPTGGRRAFDRRSINL